MLSIHYINNRNKRFNSSHKLCCSVAVLFQLFGRWRDIQSNQHEGKPWTKKLSSGCATYIGCFTRHYNVQLEGDGGCIQEDAEKEDEIPELQFLNSKQNSMDSKLRFRKKSGLTCAFRKKSRVAKSYIKKE